MSEVYLHQLFSDGGSLRGTSFCACASHGADDRGNPEAFKAGGLR